MSNREQQLIVGNAAALHRPQQRREFLRLLGVGGTVVLLPSVFAACGDDDPVGPGQPVALDLSTDTGILNYAYALEQLEAAFYTLVVDRFANIGITDENERDIFTDLRNHEVAHREFFRVALDDAAIGALQVDFGSVLANRASVLEAAEAFEDLGVAAYNGAGKYLDDPDFLAVAGKIVSVEARHASVIHALTDGIYTFADFLDDGLDEALEPSVVLAAADPFITTTITIGTAPA